MSGCENYGTVNGSTCACPPGFGGATCSQPACGGTLFQGSGRSLASGTPFANLTTCACEDGWTGTGCNVCQSAQACQSGLASVQSASSSLTGLSSGQDNSLTCNTTPRVYASGQMSCKVQVSPSSRIQGFTPHPCVPSTACIARHAGTRSARRRASTRLLCAAAFMAPG